MGAFEFEATLRAELRQAAEREQRRGALARLMAAAHALAPTIRQSAIPLVVATATVVLVAVAAIALISRTDRRTVAAPKEVARLTLGDYLGPPVTAYGSVWMSDGTSRGLLRIDPGSRGVIARLPVYGDASVAPGAGALWALQKGPPGKPLMGSHAGDEYRGPLLRVDPSTNRVTARIGLRTPEGRRVSGTRVLTDRDNIWVTTPQGALRIDPRTNRVTTAISSGEFVGSDFTLSPEGLWARTVDRRLILFDPSTGARLRTTQLALTQVGDAPLIETLGDGLAASVPGGLTRVDPHTGRILWQRVLGQRISGWTQLDGLIWARSSGGKHDRLSALDPGTGRVVSSSELDDFGGSGIAAVDDELWLTTVGGTVEVLRP